MSRKTLEGNCHNYYHSGSGKNVVTWPWRGTVFVLATKFAQLAWVTRRAEQEYKRAHLERGRRASAVQLETPGA